METVENLVNISQPMIKEKNIEFSFHINQIEKEYLYADQLRLNQIYINILSNAIQYTEPGGRVSVDLREEASDVPGCIRLVYTVADTGIGMSPEFMANMYQAFSRQTDSRVNSIQGTGLGLAITKQMVDLMGGTIDCQSEQGVGTTFTVVLDIPVADRQRDEMRLEPIDVLIVDDDEVMLQTAVDTLESLGATAEQAHSGLEALGMIEHRRLSGKDYDVIIVDWKMPGLDGPETIRRIRSETGSEVPIMLISAYDWSDIEAEAREAGVSAFVSKPLFRTKFVRVFKSLLDSERGDSKDRPLKKLEELSYSDKRILLAEDNPINAEIATHILQMTGLIVEHAEDGAEAVEKFRSAAPGRYSLIFMDIQMPRVNGYDATMAIRALGTEQARTIPIIAMTANAFEEDRQNAYKAGMNGHIAKPLNFDELSQVLQRWL